MSPATKSITTRDAIPRRFIITIDHVTSVESRTIAIQSEPNNWRRFDDFFEAGKKDPKGRSIAVRRGDNTEVSSDSSNIDVSRVLCH